MHSEAWESLKKWLLEHKAISSDVETPAQIHRLDLSNLGLKSLPETLGLLKELSVLNLSHNQLSTLPDAIAQLEKLSNLDLRRNSFETVPEVLCSLPIRSLNLSGNRIEDAAGLRCCTHLRVLDLNGNLIKEFGACLYEGNELRTLNLSGNLIKNVSNLLPLLATIERLNLSGNVIEQIPSEIKKLESVMELDLSDNRIADIDNAFYDLSAETIDLASNRLVKMQLHGLEDLESLTLDANPFESITIAEDFAPYLREFSCDSCGLEHFILPPSVSIETLCYSSNAIRQIPEAIGRYTNLAELDVDGNFIEELPDTLANMTRLQTLYIEGNPLSDAAKKIIKVLHPDICDINMKTGITIEPAGADDLSQMAQLVGVLFAIEQDFEIDYDKQLSGITKLYLHDGADLLVAKHEGNVVGMVTMQRLISSAEGGYVGQIEDLVVNDAYRKMGVGSRLLNKMRFIAQEYGYKRIQLAADADNDNAMQFYNRRGFRKVHLNVYHFVMG